MNGPNTTVICAVWSRDPNRESLLRGHAKNLDAQSAPLERIYVFEDGDAPPPGLPGQHLQFAEPLSIYQAWNLALAQVRTPYVANLNLDDRFAPDAIAQLAWSADHGAQLACGDWQICYSQDETDAVERDTYGPACLWRMSLHKELPRYPWRFDDGTLVKGCGDWLFWRELKKRKKKIARLPSIIGRYHHHPGDQAEFRFRGEDDLARGTARCFMP